MKKKLFFTLLSFACLFTSKIFAQTTQEEYNYLTKGYKIQIENGLDVKKGYTLIDLGDWGLNSGNESRTCIFKGLVRQGQIKPCAILLIYKRTDIPEGLKYYICIPSTDAPEYIWNQTLNFVNENVKEPQNINMYRTVIWALMNFSSSQSKK